MPRWNAVVEKSGRVSQSWDVSWLTPMQQYVELAPYVLAHVTQEAAEASVSSTAFVPVAQISTGLYRLSYALRITRAASVSSGIQVVLTWTSGGVAQSETFANLTGNTTTTRQDDSFSFKADAGTAISYELVYASAGGTTMAYDADLVLEVLP